jgi:hypothetical protein
MDVLNQALAYLKLGWSIAPIRRDGRDPATEWKYPDSWIQYQRTRATPDDVRRWEKAGDLQNLAIITGAASGLVVVDIDPRKGGTTEGLPPTGCIAKTGGGGYHYIYAYPTHLRRRIKNQANDSSADPQRRGRDVRADGGLIVAPPSIHGGDPARDLPPGGVYEWVKFDPMNLGDPPKWALEEPTREREEKPCDGAGVTPWITELLTKGAQVGSRNNDATKLAGYFAGMRVPQDIALALLTLWMRDSASPLPRHEIETVVRSVYRTESGVGQFNVMRLSEFMLKFGSSEVKWTVADWLPESTIGFLVSPPAGFKTWITYDLAVSIATGKPFLDKYPVLSSGPVLIVQQEDFAGDIASRSGNIILNRLCIEPPSTEDDSFEVSNIPSDREAPIFFHIERKVKFDDEAVMRKLHDLIKSEGIRLVIIDPLYSAARTDDYLTEAVSHMMRLKDIRDDTGCSFLIVHHTRKTTDGWDRQNLWGSQFVNAFSETSWHIRRQINKSKIILQRHFKVAGVQPFTEISFDIDNPSSRYMVETREVSEDEANSSQKEDHEDNIVDVLEEPMTLAAIADALGKDQTSTRKYLTPFIQRGVIELGADSKYRVKKAGEK